MGNPHVPPRRRRISCEPIRSEIAGSFFRSLLLRRCCFAARLTLPVRNNAYYPLLLESLACLPNSFLVQRQQMRSCFAGPLLVRFGWGYLRDNPLPTDKSPGGGGGMACRLFSPRRWVDGRRAKGAWVTSCSHPAGLLAARPDRRSTTAIVIISRERDVASGTVKRLLAV